MGMDSKREGGERPISEKELSKQRKGIYLFFVIAAAPLLLLKSVTIICCCCSVEIDDVFLLSLKVVYSLFWFYFVFVGGLNHNPQYIPHVQDSSPKSSFTLESFHPSHSAETQGVSECLYVQSNPLALAWRITSHPFCAFNRPFFLYFVPCLLRGEWVSEWGRESIWRFFFTSHCFFGRLKGCFFVCVVETWIKYLIWYQEFSTHLRFFLVRGGSWKESRISFTTFDKLVSSRNASFVVLAGGEPELGGNCLCRPRTNQINVFTCMRWNGAAAKKEGKDLAKADKRFMGQDTFDFFFLWQTSLFRIDLFLSFISSSEWKKRDEKERGKKLDSFFLSSHLSFP